MKSFLSNLWKLFKIDFTSAEIKNLTSDEVKRIQMVNTISLIGIISLCFYGTLYTFIDIATYFKAIAFYFISAFLIIGIIFINKQKYYELAKVLIILIFPTYIAINATILFGSISNSQVFILLFALIPLFLYSPKQKVKQGIFIVLNLIVYFAIIFLPSYPKPIYNIPPDYSDFFRDINVFIAFSGAFVAIIYFKKFSNEKEELLLKQSLELKKSYEHRDLVYSIIAHDLRSPFNGLMGVSDLLATRFDDLDKEKAKKLIVAVNQSATNLNSLLINLLDWSKIQSDNTKTNTQQIRLNEAIDDAILLLNDLLKAKGIKISIHIEDGLVVLADYEMLKTIFRNTISNAIKFSHKNGVIKIHAKKKAGEAIISVKDEGIGVTPDNLTKLFDISQMHSTPGTGGEKGTGLGLLLCKEFVERHDGKIWVESEIEKGSTFKFTLPVLA